MVEIISILVGGIFSWCREPIYLILKMRVPAFASTKTLSLYIWHKSNQYTKNPAEQKPKYILK